MLKQKFRKIIDILLEFFILVIVFLLPIYFAIRQENFNVFELNKLVVFRIVLAAAVLFFLAKVFLEKKFNVKGSAKIFLLVFIIFLAYFLSTIFSLHPNLSLWGNYERQQGLYTLVNYLALFVLLILYLRKKEQITSLLFLIILASLPVSLYGLIQYFGLDALKWNVNITVLTRVFSSLGQPNFLGQYLIMVIPITVYYLLVILKSFWSRFLVALVLGAQLFCLVFTYSRAAWLGFLAGFGFFIIVFCLVKNYKKTALTLISLAVISFIFVVGVNIYKAKLSQTTTLPAMNFLERLKSAADLTSGSNKIRLYYWQSALAEIGQATPLRLVLGYGPETLASIYVKYYRPDWAIYESINSFPDRSHNALLDIILSFGFFGLAVMFLFYYFIIVKTLKYLKENKKSAFKAGAKPYYWLAITILTILLSYFVYNLFSFSLTVGYVYLFLYLAILWFIINGEKSEKIININLSWLSKIIIWLGVLFIFTLFAYYQNILILIADQYYIKVKKAEINNSCPMMLKYLEKVVDLNPISTFYKQRYLYHYLNCFSAVGEKDRLTLYHNIMVQLNMIPEKEYQYATWLNAAHAKSLFGFYINPAFYAEAEKDYQALIKINPYVTSAFKDYGRLKSWQKDYQAALTIFKQGLSVMPDINSPLLNEDHRKEIKNELTNFYELIGTNYSFQKDWQKALEYYDKTLDLNPFNLPVYKKIADVYFQQGDLDKAIFYNQRGQMLNPSDYVWPFSLALLYKEKGDLAKARQYAEVAQVLKSDDKELNSLIKELKEK